MTTAARTAIERAATAMSLAALLFAGAVVAGVDRAVPPGPVSLGPDGRPPVGAAQSVPRRDADALAIIELELSLRGLSAPGRIAEQARSPTATGDPEGLLALQTALAGLAAGSAPTQAHPASPRLATTSPGALTEVTAESFMAGVAADLFAAGGRAGAAPQAGSAEPVVEPAGRPGIADLRRAMQRFRLAGDDIASETFDRVFLGLAATTPRLTDTGTDHARVATADLRARVVAERLPVPVPVPADRPAPLVAAPTDVSGVSPVAAVAGVGPGPGREVALSGDLLVGVGTSAGDLEVRAAGLGGPRGALPGVGGDMPLGVDDLGGVGTLAAIGAPVGAAQLQQARGGFVFENGVRVDFNVTRIAVVDGVEQLRSVINLPQGLDAGTLSRIAANQVGNTRLLSSNDSAAMFSVIQNELDNVGIVNLRQIDVDIDNVGLRNLRLVDPSLLPEAIPPYLR